MLKTLSQLRRYGNHVLITPIHTSSVNPALPILLSEKQAGRLAQALEYLEAIRNCGNSGPTYLEGTTFLRWQLPNSAQLTGYVEKAQIGGYAFDQVIFKYTTFDNQSGTLMQFDLYGLHLKLLKDALTSGELPGSFTTGHFGERRVSLGFCGRYYFIDTTPHELAHALVSPEQLKEENHPEGMYGVNTLQMGEMGCYSLSVPVRGQGGRDHAVTGRMLLNLADFSAQRLNNDDFFIGAERFSRDVISQEQQQAGSYSSHGE